MSAVEASWVEHRAWPRQEPVVEYGCRCSCGQVFRGTYERINYFATIHDDAPGSQHILQMRERRVCDDSWTPLLGVSPETNGEQK